MVRSRRSISKEDSLSLLAADSGVSLSSPPSATNVKRAHSATKFKSDDTDLILDDDEDDEADIGYDDDEELQHKHDEDEDDDDEDEDFVPHATPSTTTTAARKIKSTSKRRRCSGKTTTTSSKKAKIVEKTKKTKTTKSTSSTTSASSTTTLVATAAPAAAPSATLTANRKPHKSYGCSICNKKFGGKSDLQRHMLIHSNERPYKCDKCDKSYRQAVNLKNHYTTVHENQKQYKCQQCPKAFALKERLRLHMRLHSGVKPYACALCNKRFARGGQLSQHILTNHPNDSTLKQFRCSTCSSAFTTAANLRAHQERHEQGPDHACDICFEHFSNEDILRAHMHKAHQKLESFKCKICKETIDDANSAEHMKKHAQTKTHVCEICQAYFTQKSQYNVHMRMHTGERPYQCRICWQSFAHTSVLKLHIRKHTGEKPFQCLLCTDETSFSQLAHLKNHMKKIHKQENSYMCTGCGEFFKIKSELQTHIERSKSCDKNNETEKQQEEEQLSKFRFHIALLMKKISTEAKLKQLGYEKRLIDNVLVAALKLANRKAHDDASLSAIERMRLNVKEFLNWIVPAQVMEEFHQAQLSDESILDKIATVYMKQK